MSPSNDSLPQKDPREGVWFAGRKVLLIDDDEILLHAVSHVLEREGCKVSATADGPAGIDLYRKEHPHLVLLDIGLPTMSGTEVLREIKACDPCACVIIITGYQEKSSALRLGAYDFIQKPFLPEELVSRIKKALQSIAGETGCRDGPTGTPSLQRK